MARTIRRTLARHPRPAAALAARVVLGVGFLLFSLLAAGMGLVLFDADRDNAVVGLVLDIAGFFGGPFEGLFDGEDRKTQVVFDWGLAAVVYAVAAAVLAAVINRTGRIGR